MCKPTQNRVLKGITANSESGGGEGARGQYGRAADEGAHRRRRSTKEDPGPLLTVPLPAPKSAPPRAAAPVPTCRRAPARTPAPNGRPRTTHQTCRQPDASSQTPARWPSQLSAAARLAPYFTIYLMVRHHPELERPGRARPALPLGIARLRHGGRGRPAARRGCLSMICSPTERLRRAVPGAPAIWTSSPHPSGYFNQGAKGRSEVNQRRRGKIGVHRPQPPTRLCAVALLRC